MKTESDLETTTPHQQFLDALPGYVRIDKTQALHAALSRMFSNGWTPQQLATEITRNWPQGASGGLVQFRLEQRAEQKPPEPGISKGRSVPYCGICEDPSFRFITDTEGRAVRCPTCHPGGS